MADQERGVFHEPSSIAEAEEEISRLKEKIIKDRAKSVAGRALLAEAMSVQFARPAERRVGISPDAERLFFLETWVEEKLAAAIYIPPRTINRARQEEAELMARMADLRFRIEAYEQSEIFDKVRLALVAKRRWLSARERFVARWINEQLTLPPEIVIAKNTAEPLGLPESDQEIVVLEKEIESLVCQLDELVVAHNSEERLSLLLRIGTKKERLVFLEGWQKEFREKEKISLARDSFIKQRRDRKISAEINKQRVMADETVEESRRLAKLVSDIDDKLSRPGTRAMREALVREKRRIELRLTYLRQQRRLFVGRAAELKIDAGEPADTIMALEEFDTLQKRMESMSGSQPNDEKRACRERLRFLRKWLDHNLST